MLIERADVIVTSSGRNFVTLKIPTYDGVVGYGDGTLNGCDAHAIEDTWQYPYERRTCR